MARTVRTFVEVTDDFTGKIDTDAETVGFGLRGTAYEVDLGPSSAAQLEQALAPFISVARKVRKTSRKPGTKVTPTQSGEQKRIRQWASENGHTVAPVGRIDRAIVAAYHRAHATPAEAELSNRQYS